MENTQPKAKILAVEDDKMLSGIYELKLKSQGYLVETAANGEEGLEKARTFMPDLILLDLMMPVMDGYSMLARLRADDTLKNTKVIVLTNLGQEGDIKRAVEYGILDYVVKTDTATNEIIQKVDHVLTA
jgi:two-component system alkaline phosphatase synthesis response regulator PhoP